MRRVSITLRPASSGGTGCSCMRLCWLMLGSLPLFMAPAQVVQMNVRSSGPTLVSDSRVSTSANLTLVACGERGWSMHGSGRLGRRAGKSAGMACTSLTHLLRSRAGTSRRVECARAAAADVRRAHGKERRKLGGCGAAPRRQSRASCRASCSSCPVGFPRLCRLSSRLRCASHPVGCPVGFPDLLSLLLGLGCASCSMGCPVGFPRLCRLSSRLRRASHPVGCCIVLPGHGLHLLYNALHACASIGSRGAPLSHVGPCMDRPRQ